jgi:hypothetical protein
VPIHVSKSLFQRLPSVTITTPIISHSATSLLCGTGYYFPDEDGSGAGGSLAIGKFGLVGYAEGEGPVEVFHESFIAPLSDWFTRDC